MFAKAQQRKADNDVGATTKLIDLLLSKGADSKRELTLGSVRTTIAAQATRLGADELELVLKRAKADPRRGDRNGVCLIEIAINTALTIEDASADATIVRKIDLLVAAGALPPTDPKTGQRG